TTVESMSDRYPGDPAVRSGLVTAQLWQGWPRQGLRGLQELIARTTLDVPRVDNAPARISRAGALSSLGDLAAARRDAHDLVSLYPDNAHARRLHRDVDI